MKNHGDDVWCDELLDLVVKFWVSPHCNISFNLTMPRIVPYFELRHTEACSDVCLRSYVLLCCIPENSPTWYWATSDPTMFWKASSLQALGTLSTIIVKYWLRVVYFCNGLEYQFNLSVNFFQMVCYIKSSNDTIDKVWHRTTNNIKIRFGERSC